MSRMAVYVLRYGKKYYVSDCSDSRGTHIDVVNSVQEAKWLSEAQGDKIRDRIGGVLVQVEVIMKECDF